LSPQLSGGRPPRSCQQSAPPVPPPNAWPPLSPQGGDWSAVINEQTQATLPADAQPAAVVAAAGPSAGGGAGPAASPFSRASVHRRVGEAAAKVSWRACGKGSL
jgi:hypothetical protein